MKIISTLALSFVLITFAVAQSPRTVLIEEVTNASCGPCATQNPGFDVLLDANTDKAVVIKYQYNFPGFDPMYHHNPSDVANRATYYSINGVPTAMLDGKKITGSYPGFNGQWYAGAPGGFSQATLNHGVSFTSPFELDLDYTLTENKITITAGATCTEATSGNLKFHVAVIEKQINFATAPGTNGEKQFNNVMKKMLPVPNGEAMAPSYEVGDEFTTEQSWNLSNVYNLDKIAVVVYVQDDAGKSVLQAKELFKGYYGLDAEVLKVGIPTHTCDPMITPSVTIRNNGVADLTSLDIDYVLNDATGTVNWTGSLAFNESEEFSLGDITFTPDDNNRVEATISNPNNGEDEKASNNLMISDKVKMSVDATLGIIVEIHTDYYPGETSWEIRNSSNQFIAGANYSGPENGGGSNANTIKSHQVTLDPYECYGFKLKDGYGDGMQYGPAGSPPFGYKIIDSNGNVIAGQLQNNFNFGTQLVVGLETANVVSVDEITSLTSIEMYPNPTHSNVNIAFELTEPDHITIKVVNILGQVVKSHDLGTLSSGHTTKNIDVSNLSSGLYLININTKDSQVVRKLTITE